MLHSSTQQVLRRPPLTSGFTLIELVVVMVIIGVLAAGAALSLNSGSRQTQMKSATKELYGSFRYAQEEAILTGKMIGVNISEHIDVDTDNFSENIFYRFTWLELYTPGQNVTRAQANSQNSGANNNLNTINNSIQNSAQLADPDDNEITGLTLKKRRFIIYGTALDQVDDKQEESDQETSEKKRNVPTELAAVEADGPLSVNIIPKDFSFEFSQQGSIVDTELFQREALTAQKTADDEEPEEISHPAHIRFYPDGEVDEFRIALIDNKDTSQGFVIESTNGVDINFRPLNDDGNF